MPRENYNVVLWVDKDIEVQLGPFRDFDSASKVLTGPAASIAEIVAPKHYYDVEMFITRNSEIVSSAKVRKKKNG